MLFLDLYMKLLKSKQCYISFGIELYSKHQYFNYGKSSLDIAIGHSSDILGLVQWTLQYHLLVFNLIIYIYVNKDLYTIMTTHCRVFDVYVQK